MAKYFEGSILGDGWTEKKYGAGGMAKYFWRGLHGKFFWKVRWQKMFGGVALFFLPSPITLSPIHHNSMSLVQFQYLCIIFLHLNIYACLPNELPVFSFTLPDI